MKRKPKFKVFDPRTKEEIDLDAAACALHNMGATLAANTQAGDLEWFAERLYGMSNFGAGSVDTFHWGLDNDEFLFLGLHPDRQWAGKKWETLEDGQRQAWIKLARLCLYAIPHICERIGHRFMEQSKVLRILMKGQK